MWAGGPINFRTRISESRVACVVFSRLKCAMVGCVIFKWGERSRLHEAKENLAPVAEGVCYRLCCAQHPHIVYPGCT